MNQIENRLTQIIAEIDRLQTSIDYNYEKFAFIIQRAFAEGKRIEVSGQGGFNGHFWHLEAVPIYTKLLFIDESMIFRDNMQNDYSIEIENITLIVIKELEDGLSSTYNERTSSPYEASQNCGDRNTTGRKL